MSIPPAIVFTAKKGWSWQWQQLMNGLAPKDKNGNYQRPPTEHQTANPLSRSDLQERKHEELPRLLIGRSCPWAHRTWLVHQIRGLQESLIIQMVKANDNAGRWELEASWLGCKSLISLYRICGSPPNHRATVPVLIDPGKETKNNYKPKILGNESTQLIEVLNQWPTNTDAPDLAPNELQEEIKAWEKLIQQNINNGVYKCGFARNQAAYDRAIEALFKTLEKIEQSLGMKGPWICGKRLTLADIRLFPTLVRWEVVYMPLFKCISKPLWFFPKIWEWRQNFMNLPEVYETCDSKAWQQDYFGALFPINPSGIIPNGPNLGEIIYAPSPHK